MQPTKHDHIVLSKLGLGCPCISLSQARSSKPSIQSHQPFPIHLAMMGETDDSVKSFASRSRFLLSPWSPIGLLFRLQVLLSPRIEWPIGLLLMSRRPVRASCVNKLLNDLTSRHFSPSSTDRRIAGDSALPPPIRRRPHLWRPHGCPRRGLGLNRRRI